MTPRYDLWTLHDILNFRLAMPAEHYRVCVVPEHHGRGYSHDFIATKFSHIDTVRHYRARNREDCHIYGRPLSTRYVLIDDLWG
jgi:hypothetical protein